MSTHGRAGDLATPRSWKNRSRTLREPLRGEARGSARQRASGASSYSFARRKASRTLDDRCARRPGLSLHYHCRDHAKAWLCRPDPLASPQHSTALFPTGCGSRQQAADPPRGSSRGGQGVLPLNRLPQIGYNHGTLRPEVFPCPFMSITAVVATSALKPWS